MYKFLSGFFFISGVLLASLDVGNSVFPDAVLLVSIVLSAFCLLLSAYNEYKFSFLSIVCPEWVRIRKDFTDGPKRSAKTFHC